VSFPVSHTLFPDNPKTKALFARLYGRDSETFREQSERYNRILREFGKLFPSGDMHWFSAPGRTELCGNHTDHNAGRVLAASIDLDSVAVVVKTDNTVISVRSEGFEKLFSIDTRDGTVKPHEKGTTAALIRGIAARFKELGFIAGGFNAYVSSKVMVGSGLSSSASFEVLIGTILSALFNNNKVKPEIIALVGQYAENVYFGKPCGLMDQIACAVGGIISIDFKDQKKPIVKKVNFDFASQNYRCIVVNTGGNHANLTDDYTSVPQEMKSVAAFFGKSVCREITYENIVDHVKKLRGAVGDRAVLRALHFLAENDRVAEQFKVLQKGDFNEFLKRVTASGDSSFKWLQNCYTTKNPQEQGLSLALAFTKLYLDIVKQGACRVHGGGFAGTIQVFLPNKHLKQYIVLMESIFGKGSVFVLNVRSIGSVYLNKFTSLL
jgi:galactokinase